MKLNSNVIFIETDSGKRVSCCFSEDMYDEVYELSGEAKNQFFNLKNGDQVDSNYLQAFKSIGFIEGIPADKVDTDLLDQMEIKVQKIEELYSDELEAHGFSTLTITNCTSYCDCS